MNLQNPSDAPFEERWQPLPAADGVPLTKAGARSLALVLDARAIPCCIEFDGAGWQLLVPEHRISSALRELRLYEEANRGWPPPLPVARPLTGNIVPAVSVLLLLATFHNLTLLGFSLPGHGAVNFRELGAAHADKIMAGEWWRCVTALTLHADLVHLLSNLTIGGVFVILLCRELGSGLGWSLLLGSGALGNLCNAWMQAPAHRSVGASTAVFGAVGILAAISMVRHRHYLQRRWFVPVAAGVALLAILGTEGKQTDLGAHLFGFCFGVVLGGAAGFLTGKPGSPGSPGVLVNFLLALFGAGVVAVSWWLALLPGV